MYFWLTVDFPTSKATLHVDACSYAQGIRATELKGIGQLKRDGGWMPAESRRQAEDYLHSLNRVITVTECRCIQGGEHEAL
jgi:hypothetical protein